MPTKRKKQRHYKPDSERKGSPRSLRMTPEEEEWILRAAEAAGWSFSAYVIRHTVKAAKKDLGVK